MATIVFIYQADFSPLYYADASNDTPEDFLPGIPANSTNPANTDLEKLKLNIVAEKHKLTQREREVFLLAYLGMTNPDISLQLGISRNTVKKHMHSIFEKLKVSTRMELVHLVNSQIL